jgi:HAD superfamily hydrolase (TIGR01509 family)
MLKNIDAVLFDLDGTLVDSMWLWKDIDVEYLGRYGIPVPDNLQSEIEGMSFSETAAYFKERFKLKDSIDTIKEEWNRMAWDKYRNEVPLKEGVKEFLEVLKQSNIKTGVATSNSRELVELVLKQRGIDVFFDTVRTSCEAKKGKPAPDIYLLAASDLNVEPERCLVFEDLVYGIMAGKNANMRVCSVADPYSESDVIRKRELADYYIDTFHDVMKESYEILK